MPKYITMKENNLIRTGKPIWLRKKLPSGYEYEKVRRLIENGKLLTVCQEAKCPNQFECFGNNTATFLIMGDRCTRNCLFCNVATGPLALPDPDEPLRVSRAVADMKLSYVVVTSVTRDDLLDGGSGHFARTIREIRDHNPGTRVEVLIPDFMGDNQALRTVIAAKPDVLNHNIETVKRLYSTVRPQADYQRSLGLLRFVRTLNPLMPTKSGMMLGLGETTDEIRETLMDLYGTGCRILTLGQYLQPTSQHLPVVKYIPPEEFETLRDIAFEIGFEKVDSNPFARSSFNARELYRGYESR